MKILHVVESFGGGVTASIDSYVRSLSGENDTYEHHLLGALKEASFKNEGELDKYESVADLGKSAIVALRSVRRAVKILKPDIVHAHSSFAGAYVRIALSKNKVPIIYTPHCFAFERQDLKPISQKFFWLMEKLFAINTTAFVACSEREELLSRDLNPSAMVAYVPNVASVFGTRVPKLIRNRITAVGRIAAQKDPDFFCEVVKALASQDDLEFLWIGDGDEKMRGRLQALGVLITGWLPKSECEKLLSESAVYLHTAKWEGFPMAILEACEIGVPIVAREISALQSEGSGFISSSPEELAESCRRILGGEMAELNKRYWVQRLSKNKSTIQAEKLASVYKFALGEGLNRKP